MNASIFDVTVKINNTAYCLPSDPFSDFSKIRKSSRNSLYNILFYSLFTGSSQEGSQSGRVESLDCVVFWMRINFLYDDDWWDGMNLVLASIHTIRSTNSLPLVSGRKSVSTEVMMAMTEKTVRVKTIPNAFV